MVEEMDLEQLKATMQGADRAKECKIIGKVLGQAVNGEIYLKAGEAAFQYVEALLVGRGTAVIGEPSGPWAAAGKNDAEKAFNRLAIKSTGSESRNTFCHEPLIGNEGLFYRGLQKKPQVFENFGIIPKGQALMLAARNQAAIEAYNLREDARRSEAAAIANDAKIEQELDTKELAARRMKKSSEHSRKARISRLKGCTHEWAELGRKKPRKRARNVGCRGISYPKCVPMVDILRYGNGQERERTFISYDDAIRGGLYALTSPEASPPTACEESEDEEYDDGDDEQQEEDREQNNDEAAEMSDENGDDRFKFE